MRTWIFQKHPDQEGGVSRIRIGGPTSVRMIIFCAAFLLQLTKQSAPSYAGERLGELQLGADNAQVLSSLGCSLTASNSLDDRESFVVSLRFNAKDIKELMYDQHRDTLSAAGASMGEQVGPLFFTQLFTCPNSTAYIVSHDYSSPRLAGALTLIYCSAVADEGERLMHKKLGTATRLGPVGEMPLFFSSPNEMQSVPIYVAPALNLKELAVTAYKKPGGCMVQNRPAGYLYALRFTSKGMAQRELERVRRGRERALQNMKPPPKL